MTGTKDGITATQMDIKVDGLSYEVLAKALEQARVGRMHILGKLTECIAEPRADYRPFVPRIVQITIPQDMIGAVIGPGGKVIQDSEDDGYDHYHHRNRQQGRRGYLRSGQGGDGCSPVPHQEHRGAARGRRCI